MDEIESRRPAEAVQTISPIFISGMVLGVVLLIIIVQLGFYKTYLQFFPQFNGFHFVQHFHGAMMIAWLLMLLVQPILIRTGNFKLHRLAGKASYLLAPLVLMSMYLISQFRYNGLLESSGKTAAVAHLALNFPNIVFFAVLYLLAILYKGQTELHMRYMCSTAFVLIGPGLARVLMGYMALSLYDAVMVVRIVTPLITGVITIVDSVRTRRLSPFALVFGFMVLHTILWEARETMFWQTIGSAIAQLF
jgi:hypothetical protein